MQYLEIKNVSKEFGSPENKKIALKDVSFTVNKGEFITIAGPSGCGKTLLLNIIAGFMKPDTGEILVDSVEHTKPNKNIGMLMQTPALYPWKNIMGNVMLGPEFQGFEKQQCKQIAVEHMSKLGIINLQNYYPNMLSEGMKQKVAIARALAAKPDILLMDEPFGGLDAPARRELHSVLLDIWKKTGLTILFVTHRLSEAILLGSRVIVLGSSPTTLLSDIEINLKRPRDRNSKKFIKIDNQIYDMLAKP